jgi:hypothetical protein
LIPAPASDPIRGSPESSYFKKFWTPAFAGVTLGATFYEIITIGVTKIL